jgi:AbrB family looped-hinge helix DNA binding protein
MSDKGQIVVPKPSRDKHGFGKGSAFAFLETRNGHLIFRPVKGKPKLSLIGHLRKLKGLAIPELKAQCPPRL